MRATIHRVETWNDGLLYEVRDKDGTLLVRGSHEWCLGYAEGFNYAAGGVGHG